MTINYQVCAKELRKYYCFKQYQVQYKVSSSDIFAYRYQVRISPFSVVNYNAAPPARLAASANSSPLAFCLGCRGDAVLALELILSYLSLTQLPELISAERFSSQTLSPTNAASKRPRPGTTYGVHELLPAYYEYDVRLRCYA